jgi:hypothetical protein
MSIHKKIGIIFLLISILTISAHAEISRQTPLENKVL